MFFIARPTLGSLFIGRATDGAESTIFTGYGPEEVEDSDDDCVCISDEEIISPPLSVFSRSSRRGAAVLKIVDPWPSEILFYFFISSSNTAQDKG